MKVVTKRDGAGSVAYSSEILRDIVDCAIGEVDGVVKYAADSKQARENIKVDQIGEEMYIDAYVKLHYSVNVSDVASQIQNTIKSTIESMTEFKVRDVNVHVTDVEFDDN